MKIEVLDKGHVQYMDHMGTDRTVAEAAWVSMDKAENREDWEVERVIKYMARHNHWTPLAQVNLQLRIKMPIFVARQLMRSNVGIVWNEVSRRYVDSPPEVYVPETWRLRPEGGIKQGSGVSADQPRKYGTGVCEYCGSRVQKPKAGPTGKWCSEKCRSYWRKENNPDDRLTFVKSNARERGLEYSLERGDVEWPVKCPVLKTDLNYRSGEDPQYSPSIDRIDSSRGYHPDNVMVMSRKANVMKNNATPEELIQFARWVLLRYKGCVVPEESTYEGLMDYMVDYYNHLIEDGYSPEQARMVLPQSTYTEVVGNFTLAALARVYTQRADSHAQWEIQQYALAMGEVAREQFPVSWEALTGGE